MNKIYRISLNLIALERSRLAEQQLLNFQLIYFYFSKARSNYF